MGEPGIRLTSTGAISAALSAIAKQAPGAWWGSSELLSGVGVAHELDEAGWIVVPKADSIDAAWAEAEAALQPGETMDLTLESHVDGGRYLAWTMRHLDTSIVRAEAPTPAAALRALAAKLREAMG